MLLLTFEKSVKQYFSSVFVSDICKTYSSAPVSLFGQFCHCVISSTRWSEHESKSSFLQMFQSAQKFCSKMWKIHQCLVGIWKCRSLMLRTAYLSMCSAVFTVSSVKIHLLLPCLHNIHKQDASRTEILFNTVKYFKEKMHRYDSSCDHHICFDFSTAPVFFRFSFHFSAITLKLQWPSGYRTQPIRFSDSHVFFRRVEHFFIPLLFNWDQNIVCQQHFPSFLSWKYSSIFSGINPSIWQISV